MRLALPLPLTVISEMLGAPTWGCAGSRRYR